MKHRHPGILAKKKKRNRHPGILAKKKKRNRHPGILAKTGYPGSNDKESSRK